MEDRRITQEKLLAFRKLLLQEEKSAATVEKYMRDARYFAEYLGEENISKEMVIAYKKHLQEQRYAVRSINSMLSGVNKLLRFIGCSDCVVKALKLQKQVYLTKKIELTKAEYFHLLDAAREQPKLQLIMQTICATGIRVSELQHFTLEAVQKGEVVIGSKGKLRVIFIPRKLQKLLMYYVRKENIRSGAIFLAHSGQPIDRRSIWAKMKALCRIAGISPEKVFPHNLRKLFARTFYKTEKDIAKLADILGHSSINTTRIYIMETGDEHRKKIDRLGLVI